MTETIKADKALIQLLDLTFTQPVPRTKEEIAPVLDGIFAMPDLNFDEMFKVIFETDGECEWWAHEGCIYDVCEPAVVRLIASPTTTLWQIFELMRAGEPRGLLGEKGWLEEIKRRFEKMSIFEQISFIRAFLAAEGSVYRVDIGHAFRCLSFDRLPQSARLITRFATDQGFSDDWELEEFVALADAIEALVKCASAKAT
jgi:hypothetical protein